MILMIKMRNTKVSTLACGNNIKYAPKIPAIAPLAPMTGVVELKLNSIWTMLAPKPDTK